MPTDDDPDVLARRRAHLEILAERLHKTVEQLQRTAFGTSDGN